MIHPNDTAISICQALHTHTKCSSDTRCYCRCKSSFLPLPWPSHELVLLQTKTNKLSLLSTSVCLGPPLATLASFQRLHLSEWSLHRAAPYLLVCSADGITECLDLHWSEWCSPLCNIKKEGGAEGDGWKGIWRRESVWEEKTGSAEIIFFKFVSSDSVSLCTQGMSRNKIIACLINSVTFRGRRDISSELMFF